jgi:predicted nuclease of predicted toxin-antitoxin system
MISCSSKIRADENIQSEVIEFLRREGFDVLAARESLPEGTSDADILCQAFEERRIVLTHDRNFSTLAIAGQQSTFAILHVRPGHIRRHLPSKHCVLCSLCRKIQDLSHHTSLLSSAPVRHSKFVFGTGSFFFPSQNLNHQEPL